MYFLKPKDMFFLTIFGSILQISFCVTSNSPGHILFMNPTYGGTHEKVLWDLGNEFIKIGYNVTFVRFLYNGQMFLPEMPGMEIITVPYNTTTVSSKYIDNNGALHVPKAILWDKKRRYWNIPSDGFSVIEAYCHTILGNKQLIRRLKETKITVAVVDMLINECGLALTHQLKVPVVGFWGGVANVAEANIINGFIPPSMRVNFMTDITDLTWFTHRLWNVLTSFVDIFITRYTIWSCDSFIKQYYPTSPDSFDLLMNISVLLVNSHQAMEYPGFDSPLLIRTGCLSCKEPKPLSQDLTSWVKKGGIRGTVVFTLGITGFHSSMVPRVVLDNIMKAFSRLDMQVVMKFNASHLYSSIPDNVMVMDYIPQNDLLGSKYVGALVTHCGLKSVMEAVYHNVPMVAIPIFGDQGDNAERMVERGIAIALDKNSMTSEELAGAITAVATQPKYINAVKRLSDIMKETEEEPPMSRAMRWIQMTEKHKELRHLKPNTRSLYLLQHLLLDMFLLLLVVLYLLKYLAQKMFNFWRSDTKAKNIKKNQ